MNLHYNFPSVFTKQIHAEHLTRLFQLYFCYFTFVVNIQVQKYRRFEIQRNFYQAFLVGTEELLERLTFRLFSILHSLANTEVFLRFIYFLSNLAAMLRNIIQFYHKITRNRKDANILCEGRFTYNKVSVLPISPTKPRGSFALQRNLTNRMSMRYQEHMSCDVIFL